MLPPPFGIGRSDRIATAGSCFAQHIARTLVAQGFDYLVTETGPEDQGFGLYPARFGNIYTARQLLQLFQRAYGLFEPRRAAWRVDGGWLDPFRPTVHGSGLPTPEDVLADRARHLDAVRRMFESADVFVFTLGLTEAWIDGDDGSVLPLAPGVVGAAEAQASADFHNFTVEEVTGDLLAFVDAFRILKPDVRIILTVSPVPLVATYGDRHVLTATTYSKAVLRVAAEQVSRAHEGVVYFPSYEIVTGAHQGGRFFEADKRSVSPEGVAHVMSIFSRHFLKPDSAAVWTAPPSKATGEDRLDEHKALGEVVCDEELIDR